MKRRGFLKAMGAAGAAGLVQPKFLFAQGAPSGPIKNFVHIFLYGGMDGRFSYPYISGEMANFIREVRPNVGIPAAQDVLTVSGMNQNGRRNPIGFHPYLKDLRDKIEETGCGVTLISEYGVTGGNSFSHEVATGHFQVGSNKNPDQFKQGWLPRLIDTCNMPAMTVWGLGESSHRMFNAEEEPPMVLAGLGSYTFYDRNFGSFKGSVGAEDSAYQREIAQKLTAAERPEIPFDKALSQTVGNVYPTVGIVKAMSSIALNDALFRPTEGWYSTFQWNMFDIAKVINYSNSASATDELRNSSKIICAALGGWDAHADINGNYYYQLRYLAGGVRGLIHYLKAWNLLDSTVIQIHTEFGRTTRRNTSGGLDHAASNISCVLGGRVRRSVIGPDPSNEEATTQNFFTPQVAFTGVLKHILSGTGVTNDQLAQIFKDKLPGEDGISFLA